MSLMEALEILTYSIAAIVNLAYYATHANGKKHIRLYSGIVLALSVILDHDMDTVWHILVGVLPLFDALIDWNRKTVPIEPAIKRTRKKPSKKRGT